MGGEVWLGDKDGRQLDLSTREVVPTEAFRERLIINGQMFRVVDTAVVAPLGVKEYLITTPALATHGCWLYAFSLLADDDGVFLFTEDPTTTAAGAALVPQNINRNSATTADMVVTEDPTVTGDGTIFYTAPYGWWSLFQSGQQFVILKASSTYMLRWTDDGAGTNIILQLDWAEV